MTAMQDPSGAEAKVQFLMALRARGFRDTAMLRAFETVPRGDFVSRRHVDLALSDMRLPIACGQTISAPTTLAEMIAALDLGPGHRVLEIGAGTGYSAAICARMAASVVTVERFRSLATEAEARLESLGIGNAEVVHGDGLAIRFSATFDRIFVDASFDEPPRNLLAALAPEGIMVGVRRTETGGRLAVYRAGELGFSEERRGSIALPPLMPGASAAL